MSDTPLPPLTPPPLLWGWLPGCCLNVVLGVICCLMVGAHMAGRIDPDDLDMPVVLTGVALLFSIPATACACLVCPPELPGALRLWLKQAVLLQWVALLWSVFTFTAGQMGELIAFDGTLQSARQVAAAVEEFRLRKGRYPDSLGEVEMDAGRGLLQPVFRG